MATAKRLLSKAPSIIKKVYYNLVPFESRYGKEFSKTYKFLNQTLDWTPQMLKEYQFYKLRKTVANAYDNVPYYHKLMIDYGVKRAIDNIIS